MVNAIVNLEKIDDFKYLEEAGCSFYSLHL